MTREAYAKKSGSAFRTGCIAFVVLVVVLLGAVAAGGVRLSQSAERVRSETQRLTTSLTALRESFEALDVDGIKGAIGDVSESAHIIHDETSGPLWVLATHLPKVGNDAVVVRGLSDVLLDVSDNALGPISQNVDYLDTSRLFQNLASLGDVVQALVGLEQDVRPVVTRSITTIEALPNPNDEELVQAVDSSLSLLRQVDSTLESIESVISAFGLSR
ncbi:MAG: hypothetical protein IJ781_03355 [Atopobiaceae bacterium]|nr:hypothetical protein [Atopobiaceae bacterium]